jgi:hypothetical protein
MYYYIHYSIMLPLRAYTHSASLYQVSYAVRCFGFPRCKAAAPPVYAKRVGVAVEEMTRLLFMCWPFALPFALLSRRPGESNLNYVRSIINFTRLTSLRSKQSSSLNGLASLEIHPSTTLKYATFFNSRYPKCATALIVIHVIMDFGLLSVPLIVLWKVRIGLLTKLRLYFVSIASMSVVGSILRQIEQEKLSNNILFKFHLVFKLGFV